MDSGVIPVGITLAASCVFNEVLAERVAAFGSRRLKLSVPITAAKTALLPILS